jgi:hypothetical protein
LVARSPSRQHGERAGRDHDTSVDRNAAVVLRRADRPAAKVDRFRLEVVQLDPLAAVVRHGARVRHDLADRDAWRRAQLPRDVSVPDFRSHAAMATVSAIKMRMGSESNFIV